MSSTNSSISIGVTSLDELTEISDSFVMSRTQAPWEGFENCSMEEKSFLHIAMLQGPYINERLRESPLDKILCQ